jgi:2-polyprenyl-3-methyl-5-hydroxy-6-metoxy-1,4-benzoquinol methylase
LVSLESAEKSMTRRGKIAENLIFSERPELIDLFLTYQNEAMAARKYLENSLIELDSDAEILEVGGGILALAIQLASEGFKVTSVEPIGEGFAGIQFIMKVFLKIASDENLHFQLERSPIENCHFDQKFDFIFSINVMEHLKDPYSVLLKLNEMQNQGGKYRFMCPNYDFPYEPHFGKWLYLRKNKTFFLHESRLNSDLEEVVQLYNSINYISSKKLTSFMYSNDISFQFNKLALFNLLSRSLEDLGLQQRHSNLYKIVKYIHRLKLIHLTKLIPAKIQPIMDIIISK